MMASLRMQLQGFTPANREATVTLVNQSTGQTFERKPFLDGSLLVNGLDPGLYQIKVRHPNLALPIFDSPIRIFPQPRPTLVPIPVRADLFRDTPVRDIPDADLAPIQQALTATREQVAAIGVKAPGEVIRASDFNVLAQAAVDLASAMLELTRSVSPRGHNHPEIEERIDQVQGNLRSFAEAYGKSLLEIRRGMETDDLEGLVDNTLGITPLDPGTIERLRGRIADLKTLTQADTAAFTAPLANLGSSIIVELNKAALAQADGGEAFRKSANVKKLTAIAEQYSEAGVQLRPENELRTYSSGKAAVRISAVRGG